MIHTGNGTAPLHPDSRKLEEDGCGCTYHPPVKSIYKQGGGVIAHAPGGSLGGQPGIYAGGKCVPKPLGTVEKDCKSDWSKGLAVPPMAGGGSGRRGLWIGAGAALVAVFLLRGILR